MDRRRSLGRSTPLWRAAVAALVLAVAGCSIVVPDGTAPPASAAPTSIAAAPTPSAAPSAVATPGPTPTADSLTLTVTPSESMVGVGDAVGFEVAFTNHGDGRIIYQTDGCFVLLDVIAPLAAGPGGRTWPGKAGAYKAFALQQNFLADGTPALSSVDEYLESEECPRADYDVSWLDPGEAVTALFRWSGEFNDGLPTLPGQVQYRASVSVARLNQPPNGQDFTAITAEGIVTVAGTRPGYVSAGEAIDAALSNTRFAKFVEAQPEGTCEIANVYLTNWPPGVYSPPGPSWNVELLCATGVPRHFARISVDPVTAEVKGVDICRNPCWR